MQRQSTFTPLSELPPETSTLHLALPEYAPTDRIGLNMQAIGSVARWGGFNRDVVIRPYSGDTTSYSGAVMGFDGGGAAFMGGVSTTEADKSQADFDKSDGLPILGSDWRSRTDLTLRLNMSELTDQVQRSGKSVRDPATWSAGINRAVGSGLRQAAFEHLLGAPLPKEEVFYSVLDAGGMAMLSTIGAAHMPHPHAHANHSSWLYVGASITAINSVKVALSLIGSRRLDSLCYSLIPAYQIDRCAIVAGMVAARKFAKPLERAA